MAAVTARSVARVCVPPRSPLRHATVPLSPRRTRHAAHLPFSRTLSQLPLTCGAEAGQRQRQRQSSRGVRRWRSRVFWDLDNIRPYWSDKLSVEQLIDPLHYLATTWGELESMDAWGNPSTFLFKREDEPELTLEQIPFSWTCNASGWDPREEEYRCGVCGSKHKTPDKLRRHMRIHDRERKKILNRKDSHRKGARGAKKLSERMETRLSVYNSARKFVTAKPKENSLHESLVGFGVNVHRVAKGPEKADEALKTAAQQFLGGLHVHERGCLVLVSGDSDFAPLLRACRRRGNVDVALATLGGYGRAAGKALVNSCDVVVSLPNRSLTPLSARGREMVELADEFEMRASLGDWEDFEDDERYLDYLDDMEEDSIEWVGLR